MESGDLLKRNEESPVPDVPEEELETINEAFWAQDNELFEQVEQDSIQAEESEKKNKDENHQAQTQVLVNEVNTRFSTVKRLYENVLAPELVKNEELKRTHKKILMKKIFSILKWQFIATYVIVFLIVVIIAVSKKLGLSDIAIKQIISFMKFYITSIVAELIAILFFIVKDVFDKSIVDLFKNFDSKDKAKDVEEEN